MVRPVYRSNHAVIWIEPKIDFCAAIFPSQVRPMTWRSSVSGQDGNLQGCGPADKGLRTLRSGKNDGDACDRPTRMATESAVTTRGAHPILDRTRPNVSVHNGSLSNHNALRRELKRSGFTFATENDSKSRRATFPGACRKARL